MLHVLQELKQIFSCIHVLTCCTKEGAERKEEERVVARGEPMKVRGERNERIREKRGRERRVKQQRERKEDENEKEE